METETTLPTPQVKGKLYYGWVIAATLAVTETVSWGILYYGFSVFLVPMEKALDATRTQLSGSFSLALVLAALAAIPVGRWIDRHGARGLMTLGSILATGLVLAWSQVQTLPALYLVFGGIGLISAMVLYEPAFTVITAWFHRRRRQALTLLTLVAGLASTIFIPLSNWLLEMHGWRAALVILAIILAVITIPLHALVLRRRPQDMGLEPDGAFTNHAEDQPTHPTVTSVPAREALRSASFGMLTAAFVLSSGAGVAIGVHFIPYLLGHGYSGAFAATAAGLIGLMQLPGRALYAPLSRWIPRRWLGAAIFASQGVALLILIGVRSLSGVYAFAILFGMTNGVLTLARAASVADFFGPTHYGNINGVLGLWTTLARAAGPTGLAWLYLMAGQYESPFALLVLVMGISALAYYAAEHFLTRDHRRWASRVAAPSS